MRTKLAIVVVVAQLAVLAFMAGEREWVMRTGRTFFLRTAPIDPRDPMRGDYVRLGYEVSNVPKSLCREGVAAWFSAKDYAARKAYRDRKVYAEVKLDGEGIAELVALSDRRPDAGIFLRGRVQEVTPEQVVVRFGVEALFMQQGRAQTFENEVRGPKAGVPVNVEISVGSSGLAVLKGYRWEPLGITLTMDPLPPRAERGPGATPVGLSGVTVVLKNHSESPVAIIDRPGARSFRLVPAEARWRTEGARWQWVGEERPPGKPTPDHVRVLKPGETHTTHIDLTLPEWFVEKVGEKKPLGARSLGKLAGEWGAWFRLEYAPPSALDCVGLPQAELIRHSALRSRQFSPAGNAD